MKLMYNYTKSCTVVQYIHYGNKSEYLVFNIVY